MVLYHIFGRQIFNADDIILANKISGQLVQHIVTLIANTFMHPSDGDPCLLPALAPLCFSGESALEAGKFAFALAQVAVIRIFDTIRGNGKGFETYVNADNSPCTGQRINFHVSTTKGDKVFTTRILGNCCRENAASHLL